MRAGVEVDDLRDAELPGFRTRLVFKRDSVGIVVDFLLEMEDLVPRWAGVGVMREGPNREVLGTTLYNRESDRGHLSLLSKGIHH